MLNTIFVLILPTVATLLLGLLHRLSSLVLALILLILKRRLIVHLLSKVTTTIVTAVCIVEIAGLALLGYCFKKSTGK